MKTSALGHAFATLLVATVAAAQTTCWVEFLKGGAVAGREVASVVTAEDIRGVAKRPINSAGTNDLINMPVAR